MLLMAIIEFPGIYKTPPRQVVDNFSAHDIYFIKAFDIFNMQHLVRYLKHMD